MLKTRNECAAELIECMQGGHGEIFADYFLSGTSQERNLIAALGLAETDSKQEDIRSFTCEQLATLQDSYSEEYQDGTCEAWLRELLEAKLATRQDCFAWWRKYFERNNSHGEYAGAWCGRLWLEEEWDELWAILVLLKSDGTYGFDS